jgi:hypothetical protein
MVALRALLGGSARGLADTQAVRSSLVANVMRTWQLSRMEWFWP